MKHPVLILFLILAALLLGQAAYYHPQLPGLVATHFAASGRATGWMPRGHFLQYQVVFALGFTAFFFSLAFVSSLLPPAWINVPHKDYWLAPSRREATRQRLARMILGAGCGALAFFLFLHHRICQANLDGTRRLTPSIGVFFGICLLLIAGPVVAALLGFLRKTPAASR
ncbi:MAG TPA: DUF1648 domain-containing protein [Opitutaceae bacterium]|nr:DUF1648 domain-containing protein [Opitutaceae bacterium]